MGLFDSFNKKKKREEDIRANNKKMAQLQREIAESKERVVQIDKEQKDLLIKAYGSLDKVPDSMLKMFKVKK
jgi:hypothetical protein